LEHEAVVEAARRLYGLPVIAPSRIYANVLVPGQELGVHTDVPEFRGLSRGDLPLWLAVVMHHSRLFTRWHVPMATAIVYPSECEGGDFVYFPHGEGKTSDVPVTIAAAVGMAVVLDADTVFHGVDRVLGDESGLRAFRGPMRLVPRAGDNCDLERVVPAPGERVASYHHGELRFSVSWKGYCFADDADRRRWASRDDGLCLERVLQDLRMELCRRGRMDRPDRHLGESEFGLLVIDEFVRFPVPSDGVPNPTTNQPQATSPH
jgi:hypothetical protein